LLLTSCFLSALTMVASAESTTITGSVGEDTTPPAAVTDLEVINYDSNSLAFSWTAPGDDGTVGTAAQYDIRYSNSAITNANWDLAFQCTGEPTPQPAGSSETFAITGLSPGTLYYIGLKTADEVPNQSDLSNILSIRTLALSGGRNPTARYILDADFMGEKTRIKINPDGTLQDDVTLTSPDGDWKLEIAKDTQILTADGEAAGEIVAREITEELPPPPDGTIAKAFELGPSGITFDPPATLKLTLPASELPENVSSVVIAYYSSETGWTEIQTEWNRTDDVVIATVQIVHFTPFAVIYQLIPPPVLTISDLTIFPAQVEPEQEVVITTVVTNSGGSTGNYIVWLKINGMTKTSKRIYVDADTSIVVDFTITREEKGTYQVDVNGLTGEFTVVEPPPVFTISDLTIPPGQVEPGQEIIIAVTVTNSGGSTGNYTAKLKINDLMETSKQLSVDAGASAIVEFAVTRDESGNYRIDVNGLTGEFTVVEPPPVQKGETAPPPQLLLSVRWYIWVVIGLLLVFIGTTTWLIVKRRNQG
jgi:hypothetical protein